MSTDLVKLSQPRVNTVVSSRILLVDDEPTMRLFMQALLQKRGFAVTVATSVADAR